MITSLFKNLKIAGKPSISALGTPQQFFLFCLSVVNAVLCCTLINLLDSPQHFYKIFNYRLQFLLLGKVQCVTLQMSVCSLKTIGFTSYLASWFTNKKVL